MLSPLFFIQRFFLFLLKIIRVFDPLSRGEYFLKNLFLSIK